MTNENYYEKLKKSHPVFNDLNLDERQKESLKSLLSYSAGSLNSLRNKIAELSQDAIHSAEYKAKKLKEAKAELQKTLDREFSVFKTKTALAQQSLHSATHSEPKDSVEALLQYMQQQEIRAGLKELPSAKRIEILLDSVQRGDSTILRAVQEQPLTSDLVPGDVLDRTSTTYSKKVAPQQLESLTTAKADLEAAEKIKNLTEVALGFVERNL
ncbi:MAG: hypothetical protein DRH50_12165 [Deltaproteobacteria bacterium]|nr:MAG: hypothetical protein DRH50_12165 [Deltaproteobacteria bacterium]